MYKIKWQSSRGWDLYYYTDGVRHGETTDRDKATLVSRARFNKLRDDKLIPKDAEMRIYEKH